MLEIKGGGIEIEAGRWFSVNREGRYPIKNPFEQATASKHALVAYLNGCGFVMRDIPVTHAVAFPDIPVNDPIAPYAPAAITWDGYALRDLRKALMRTIAHWGVSCRIGDAELARIVGRLAPTVQIRRRLAEDLADADAALVELTERQVWAFSQLRRVRNAFVTGGAGTGKTVLAVERARRLAGDGFRTLLACYNDLLSRKLADELHRVADVRVGTFHSLCLAEAARAHLPIPTDRDEAWWEHAAPSLLEKAIGVTGTSYDAVIVDEGQDFSQSWLDALRRFTANIDSPPFYVFADSHQQLYRRTWKPPADWLPIELDLNCRSTHPIAIRTSAVFGEEPLSKGADGPSPRYYVLNQHDGLRLVQDFVARLIADEGVSPNRVCVLCDDTRSVNRLQQLLAGDTPFVRYGSSGIVVETIARFKGLEAEALVLVLSDRIQNDAQGCAVLYTGLSRARSALFVFGPNEVKQIARWP